MKWIVKIVLVIFIAFIAMPTIVSFIEKSNNKTCFYNVTEEDVNEKEIDIKAYFVFQDDFKPSYFLVKKSNVILSKNLSKHDNIAATIFIPPPELI